MSRMLQQLIGSQGRLVDQMLTSLERATAQPCYDVDLMGRILTASNRKLRQLGFQSGAVTATELELTLKRHFATLEQRFEQQFATNEDLIQLINQVLDGVKVIELSSVVRDRFNAYQVDLFDKIASSQRGYFQAVPLRIVTEPVGFDERLVAEVAWQPAATRLRGFLLTALMVSERVRQSNQLALILASQNRPVRFKSWLEQSDRVGWTLTGFPVASEAIERILADRDSELHRQLRHIQPELADNFSIFQLEQFVNAVVNDPIFADSYGLGLADGRVVSFNIFDQVVQNNQQLYATVYYQLIEKYLQNPNLIKQILNQLDKKLIKST